MGSLAFGMLLRREHWLAVSPTPSGVAPPPVAKLDNGLPRHLRRSIAVAPRSRQGADREPLVAPPAYGTIAARRGGNPCRTTKSSAFSISAGRSNRQAVRMAARSFTTPGT